MFGNIEVDKRRSLLLSRRRKWLSLLEIKNAIAILVSMDKTLQFVSIVLLSFSFELPLYVVTTICSSNELAMFFEIFNVCNICCCICGRFKLEVGIMRTMDFNDLRMASIFDRDMEKLKRLVYKQLAFGRYKIEGTTCRVRIRIGETEFLEVLIDNTIYITQDLHVDIHNCKKIYSKEPALEYFANYLENYNRDNNRYEDEIYVLVLLLEKYKKEHTISGCDLETVEILKLYSPKKELLNNDKRENYGAGFIDYEKQIHDQRAFPIIHNEGGLNGIWASTKAGFNNSISEENRNDFGSSLFILKPMEDCQYFIFPVKSNGDFSGAKEIIGDRFQVVKKMELHNDINEWEQVGSAELNELISDTGKKIGLLKRILERFNILDYFRSIE